MFTKKPTTLKTFRFKYLADMETPVSCYQKLTKDEQDTFILESMENDGARMGRYSVIGMKPMLTFQHQHGKTQIVHHLQKNTTQWSGDPFDHLRQILGAFTFERTEQFECGVLCGYIGYDAISYIEKIPQNNPTNLSAPQILFVMPLELIIFDNFNHTMQIVLHYQSQTSEDLQLNVEKLERKAQKRLKQIIKLLAKKKSAVIKMKKHNQVSWDKVSINLSDTDFTQKVQKAKDYIYNGDIFQVVLSRRFSAPFSSDPLDIYRLLRLINPSPYMYYFNLSSMKIVGSSPETLVKYDGNRVLVYPIAGTRPRGKNALEDDQIAQELLADEKELAEHVMLVNLGRNDLGKIAQYGSVNVDRFKKIERFSHVMHITSIVAAKLKENYDTVDIFKSCFPAGTVSGAPKIRAMQIIDELENINRGPYAGAIGYFDFQGRMDTCIAIRTIWVEEEQAVWQAGAGIVADSDPSKEENETRIKASALLAAINMAEEKAD